MKVTKFVEHTIQGTRGCFDLDISHINPKINSEMNTICIKLNLCPSKNRLLTLYHGDFDLSTKKQYRSSPPIWVHV